MGIELGFGLFKDVFINTFVFNVSWIFSFLITLFSLVLISRDKNSWKDLALPVMIGWDIAGIEPFFLLYIVAGLVMVTNNMSLRTLSNLADINVKLPGLSSISRSTGSSIKRKSVSSFKSGRETSKLAAQAASQIGSGLSSSIKERLSRSDKYPVLTQKDIDNIIKKGAKK